MDNLQDGIAEDMDVGIVVFSPFDSGDHTFHRTHFFYPMMNFLYPGHDRNTNSNGSHMEEGFHINYRMQIEFCQSKSSFSLLPGGGLHRASRQALDNEGRENPV